jgi:hypothetical protein
MLDEVARDLRLDGAGKPVYGRVDYQERSLAG